MKANYKVKHQMYHDGKGGRTYELQLGSRRGDTVRAFKYIKCGCCNKVIADTSSPDFDELEAPRYCFKCACKVGYFHVDEVADMPEDGTEMTEVIHKCCGCGMYVTDIHAKYWGIGMTCPNCSGQLVAVVKEIADES